MSLEYKIDFALIISVNKANPNGDPLNGNRPRTDYDGYGEITDVCLKRKIRDRLLEQGHSILVQSRDNNKDKMTSIKSRAESTEHGLGPNIFSDAESAIKKACEKWFDVRSFGQVFPFKGKKSNNGNTKEDNPVSIAIRGPVTIQSAFSIKPINIDSIQITKSVNGEGNSIEKTADTMGMKHRVDKAIYLVFGAITPQLAEKTGFSNEDAKIIKEILPKLFEGDASSARPEGSMQVKKVFWWQHNSKLGQYSSARVHNSLQVSPNQETEFEYKIVAESLNGFQPEIIEGF